VIREYVKDSKTRISASLKKELDRRRHLSRIPAFGPDLIDTVYAFASSGKMLRGALVALGSDVYGKTVTDLHDTVGAAVELIQTFLLIHDDIMDRDETRRGAPSVYHRYVSHAEREGIADGYHLGESMGICVGDIAMVLAFEILSDLDCDPALMNRMIRVSSREIALVGGAQMNDMYHGYTSSGITENMILELYRLKTGRYTFSLPLILGGLLAGHQEDELNDLAAYGEAVGIIFQIKDDELGLFGDAEEIGKPVGTDIGENKRTLFREYLFRAVQGADAQRLETIFGETPVSRPDLEFVRSLLHESGAYQRVLEVVESYRLRAESLVGTMAGVTPAGKQKLLDLVRFNLERTR
jgi:geranylgeranyl diphosphate synthase, type I